MAIDPSGLAGKSDPSAFAAHDDGGLHAAMRPENGIGKSAGVMSRTAAEVTNVVGFAALFSAVGGLVALLAGTIASSAAAWAVVGIGAALGVGAIAVASTIKKSIDDRKAAEIMNTEREAAVHTVVIQPYAAPEREANFFTRMIEAERAQAKTQEPTRH